MEISALNIMNVENSWEREVSLNVMSLLIWIPEEFLLPRLSIKTH
jgi:hypothetical protein